MCCALRAVRRARLLQGRRPPRRSDPTIEFHEQDNLALASLGADDQAGQTAAAAGGGSGSENVPPPPADFIYDNSAYNNLRQAAVFPVRHACTVIRITVYYASLHVSSLHQELN